jgi:hypothetical protein
LIRERRVETVPFAPLDSRLITKAKQRNQRRCKRDKRAGGSKQSGGPVGCEKQNLIRRLVRTVITVKSGMGQMLVHFRVTFFRIVMKENSCGALSHENNY